MLLLNLNILATAPGGVARLRELIFTLAVQGKLVAQDAGDEPASELLKQIRAEKDRLIAVGKIKKDKPLAAITEGEKPFELKAGWEWSNLATIGVINPRNDAPDETIASFVEMRSIPAAFSVAHVTESRPWRDIKSGFTQFAEGDVGVAKITPCFENGKSTVFQNLSNGIGAGTTELHIVRPLGGIASRYVLLFLKTPAFILNGEAVMTGSAGQKRMPRVYFESTPLPLPPLAEQSRIVTRVEELMRLCDALEAKGRLEAAQHAQLVTTLLGTLTESDTPEQLAENWQRLATHFDLLLDRPQAVDALEQTILQLAVRGLLVPQDPTDEPASALLKKIRLEKDRLIAAGQIKRDKPLAAIAEDEHPFALPKGWTWARWADIALKIGDIDHKMPSDTKDGVPYVSPRDFYGLNEINFDGAKKIAYSDYLELSSKIRPELGDLIYPRYGTIGVVRKVVEDREFLASYSCAVIKVLRGFVEPDYQYLFSVSGCAKKQAASATNKTTQPNVGLKSIQEFLVPLPPLPEQSRIVTRVAQLRRLCADLRQRLAASQSTQAQLAEALVENVA